MRFNFNFLPRNTVFYALTFMLLATTMHGCNDKSAVQKFEHSGGTFRLAIINEPSTFVVREVKDFYSSSIMNQVLDGLVNLNPVTLNVEPALASKWEISEDGASIDFHIREDVYFHQHPAFEDPIKLTPEDVVYSIELACSPIGNKTSYTYSSIYKDLLVGAEAFFNKEKSTIEGVSIHGNIVRLQLIERDINVLDKLAQTQAKIVSKKVVEAGYETDMIGTGPFCFSGFQTVDGVEQIVLTKNPNYYQLDAQGFQLPYLDSVVFLVIKDEKLQFELFEKGELSMIEGLTPRQVSNMLGEGKIEQFNGTPPELVLVRKPLLGTQYYQFNLAQKIFQDVRIRKAFNYAINKEAIVKEILNNQAYSHGDRGIIPPDAFNGYDANNRLGKTYPYNPELAKDLLAKAGYPNGVDFPEISIKFSTSFLNSQVADEVANQLRNVLNVNVYLDGMNFQDLIADQERGEGMIFKTSWYADYYSPESFLNTAYSKSIPSDEHKVNHTNYSRYSNPEFDKVLDKARSTSDIIQQYEYFAEAEKILMEDAPFIILWYEETIKIVPTQVRSMHFNQMDYYSFKGVYLKEWTKNEWDNRLSL